MRSLLRFNLFANSSFMFQDNLKNAICQEALTEILVNRHHVGPYLYLEALRHFAKRVQKHLAVLTFDEDRLPLVAPGQHAAKGTLVVVPPCLCHQRCLSTIALYVKIYSMIKI